MEGFDTTSQTRQVISARLSLDPCLIYFSRRTAPFTFRATLNGHTYSSPSIIRCSRPSETMASGWFCIPRATPSSVTPHRPIYERPVLVIANGTEPTDHILFSTDQGLTWWDKFGEDVRLVYRPRCIQYQQRVILSVKMIFSRFTSTPRL